MPAGRPNEGAEHVEKLEGDALYKGRLKAILQVLAGNKTVREACEELNISEARFHLLRRRALQSALDGLTPASAGRPRKDEEIDPSKLKELERINSDLRVELEAARVKTEIALVMPHLLRKDFDRNGGKKNDPGKKRRR